MPSVVAIASPPAAPIGAAVSSYMIAAIDQIDQLTATLEQDINRALNALGQEVSYVVQQWESILGINPAPASNDTVRQPSSNNGMSQGHASGSGSGSDATPDQPTTSGQGSTKGQPVTSGNGSGVATPEASGGGSATIYGQVWLDSDGDGYEDNGELGFPNITVWLCSSTGTQIESEVVGSTGDYGFTVSASGPPPTNQYCIQAIIPTYDEDTIEDADNDMGTNGFTAVYTLTPGEELDLPLGMRSMNVDTLGDDPNNQIIQGKTTLRDAIETGNYGPPNPAVTFYTAPNVALTGNILLGATLPAIQKSYNIVGPGSANLTVNGNGNSGTIFTINAGVTSTISGLTIQGGKAQGNGGGILNNGNLTLSSDDIQYNQVTSNGGGLFNASGVQVTLQTTTVSGNQATRQGGGVWNSGTMNIVSGSSIQYNSARMTGAGINNSAGTITATDGTTNIIGNTGAVNGGGVNNVGGGKYRMVGGSISNNQVSGQGGGVNNSKATMTLTGVNILGDQATSAGGGGRGGGIFVASGTVTLTSDTLSVAANGVPDLGTAPK